MSEISIIVPVYKVEEYLTRCIDSILSQTFRDFELILVDDGSPDCCPAICDEYAGRDSRIVVIHQKNAGVSAARNAGIDWAFANSDSEWISFVDSDDWVAPSYLSMMRNALQIDADIDMVQCAYEVVTTEETNAVSSYNMLLWKIISGGGAQLIDSGISVNVWGKLIKKNFFRSIRFPLGKQHEDTFISWKLCIQANKIVLLKNKNYFYYQRCDSTMHTTYNEKFLNEYEAYIERLNFYNSDASKHYKNAAYVLSIHGESKLASEIIRHKHDIPMAVKRKMRLMYVRYICTCIPNWSKKFFLERCIFAFSPKLLKSLHCLSNIFKPRSH